jgi:hypothetical protein
MESSSEQRGATPARTYDGYGHTPDSQSRTDKEVTERMATNDELERIRRELEDLNAEWRANIEMPAGQDRECS